MSQAKVDDYKEHKKNRTEELQKEKRRKILVRVILIVVAAVIVFWIVFSCHRYYQNHRETKIYNVNTTAIDSFLIDLE